MRKSNAAHRIIATPAEPAQGASSATIDFTRADILPVLFGVFDRNLVAIEDRTSVSIHARGVRVSITGSPENRAIATRLLRTLYDKAVAGHEIDPEVVAYELSRRQVGEPIAMQGSPAFVTIKTRKKTIAPRTPAQASYMQHLARAEMIFALGPAGTGKTYLAVAQAVSDLMTGRVQRLVLSRPAVEAGERLGFLPGDMKEKVDPYLRPIYDALHDCMPPEQVERRIASGEIEVAPIAFMRGRTLADAFIILDEAQNTTPAQMKMFLTRFGQSSRMVICGDPNQVDLPGGPRSSGLADAVQRLERVEGMVFSHFTGEDVVRHPIVGRVVQAYEG
ncbi:PhoH family protein [Sphingomonas sp. 3-13AW]|uniref:PhoH family protein n=1 Tax=Sphingomonas sp. 3-13AW TaxID=3050450 RepID=UPI003BB77D23